MTSARRGEGVSQNWTIVREVAWIRYYESIPNVDRGTLRRSGIKNWKFVDVICTSPLTCFATLFRETESLLKRHKHSSATSNDYRETLRETWLPMICATKNYVHWVPLIWAAFLRAKSAHISRKTLNQKYFNIWKAIWGRYILPK